MTYQSCGDTLQSLFAVRTSQLSLQAFRKPRSVPQTILSDSCPRAHVQLLVSACLSE